MFLAPCHAEFVGTDAGSYTMYSALGDGSQQGAGRALTWIASPRKGIVYKVRR